MDKKDEIWKPISGFEGIYTVSNHGRVMRVAPAPGTQVGHILKPRKNKNGYLQIKLRNSDKMEYPRIHQLVAGAFLPKPTPEQTEVNHIDGNKLNNHDWNLEWCTHKENSQHAFELGLRVSRRGEEQVGSTLTESDVLDIRARYKPGQRPTQKELAQEYGVSRPHIGHIIKRRFWKHI